MVFKILVVDDSTGAHDGREDAGRAFSRLDPRRGGQRRRCARSAGRAKAGSRVLDFNMPGRDGLDLAAQLRRLRPAMPVAVISANHQQEIVDRANAVGATFLSKPLTEPALRDFLAGAV